MLFFPKKNPMCPQLPDLSALQGSTWQGESASGATAAAASAQAQGLPALSPALLPATCWEQVHQYLLVIIPPSSVGSCSGA